MKSLNNNGNDIFHESMDELLSGKYDALTVITLADIYNNFEVVLHNWFNTSDAIMNVILKHS